MGQPRPHLGDARQIALGGGPDRALLAANPGQRPEWRQRVLHAGQVVLGQQQRVDLLLIGETDEGLEREVAGGEIGVHVHDAAHALERAGGRGGQREGERQEQPGGSHRRRPLARTRPS